MSQPAPPTVDPVLTYGVEPRFKHWRRWGVRGLVAVVLVAAAWLGLRLYRPYQAQAAHLRNQERLSRQVLPAGTVLYTEDPTRIAALRGQSGYRDARTSRTRQPEDVAAMPDAWERAYATWMFPVRIHDTSDYGNLLVHDTFGCRRVSGGGVEWIVLLSQVNPFAARNGRRTVIITQVAVRPAGRRPGDRGQYETYAGNAVLLDPSDVFTFFAPQPNPHDKSLIDVPYELNGHVGMLSAQVQDNGRVVFSVRTGPARME